MAVAALPAVSPAAPDPRGTLQQKAIELEGVFLNTLVSQMFSSLDARGGFGGGQAEETWRSMQSEMISGEIANAGGIGLADQIVRDLLAIQEAADNPAIPAPARAPQGEYSR